MHHFNLSEDVVLLNGCEAHLQFFTFLVRLPYMFGLKNLIACLKRRFHDDEQKHMMRAERGIFCTRGIFSYVKPVRSFNRNLYVYGNFQNIRSICNIESLLRDHFRIKTKPSEANKKMLDEISACNAVCLHIRRGDYLQERFRQLQVCHQEYYAEAIRRAKMTLKAPIFYIFSTGHDDIEWVKKNYQFDADITYVDLDNPDYEELRLMKACRHFIISNSTFSWWAAFLGEAEDKKVWAPEVWLKHADVDIYPATWEKIPC